MKNVGSIGEMIDIFFQKKSTFLYVLLGCLPVHDGFAVGKDSLLSLKVMDVWGWYSCWVKLHLSYHLVSMEDKPADGTRTGIFVNKKWSSASATISKAPVA